VSLKSSPRRSMEATYYQELNFECVERNRCVETLLEGKKRFLGMMSRQGSFESRPSETRRYVHQLREEPSSHDET